MTDTTALSNETPFKNAQRDVQFNFPVAAEAKERIELSDRDYDLFVEIMTADVEPTALALREVAEFRKGRMEGNRYHW